MRKQFDSCSYDELTCCITGRISWIRESYRFLADRNTAQYGHIRVKVIIGINTNKQEIKRLLNMRRVLKRSGLKNWDSDKLDEKAKV